MRPTAFGLKATAFYAVVCTAYFASPYSNLFFLLVSFLSIVYVLDVWWTTRNVHGVVGRLDDIQPIAAGVPALCQARLDGGSRRRFHVQIELGIDGVRTTVGRTLMLDGEQVVEGRIQPLPRGVHTISACRATTTYPLGLVHAATKLDAQAHIVVYPAPLREQVLDRESGLVRGRELAHAVAGATSGETAGLRDYLPGDSVRSVQWRASARSTRGLVVREYEHGADAAIEVVLDRRSDSDVLERALSAVTSLALTAQEIDQPIIVRSQDLDEAFGAGRRPLAELWAWLATAEGLPSTAPPPPPARSSDATSLPAALHRFDELVS